MVCAKPLGWFFVTCGFEYILLPGLASLEEFFSFMEVGIQNIQIKTGCFQKVLNPAVKNSLRVPTISSYCSVHSRGKVVPKGRA